ncbi:MAG: hypothetical protein ACRD51_13190 [Candidatus Acidiferrum sp.]
MNFSLMLLTGFAVLLLILLLWVLRDAGNLGEAVSSSGIGEDSGRHHLTYFPQIRQAMAGEDFDYVASKSSARLMHRVRRERRKIALGYLACLRGDFLKLWRLARVIASMSPRVGVGQEFARLRLGLIFFLRYELLRLKFVCGFVPLPELGSLCEALSKLAVRLETAMSNLGERAALAAKLASTLDGRGVNTP